MARKQVPIWGRLRKAAGWPEVMVASLARLEVQRYEDIENGRSLPTDPERESLRDVFFGPVNPQPAERCSPLDLILVDQGKDIRRILLEATQSIAKGKNLVMTSEQAEELATVVADVIKRTLERAFSEELAGADPEGRQG